MKTYKRKSSLQKLSFRSYREEIYGDHPRMFGESATRISGVEGRKGATAKQDRGVGAAEGYLGGIGEADSGEKCRAQRTDYLIENSSRRGQGIAGQSSAFQGALSGTEKQNALVAGGH